MDFSFLGPAAASVIVVYLFLQFMKEAMKELTAAIQRNTEVTKETKEFLVNLNGSLKLAVRETQKKANK